MAGSIWIRCEWKGISRKQMLINAVATGAFLVIAAVSKISDVLSQRRDRQSAN